MLTLEVAAIRTVIGFGVADDWLSGLAPPEQFSLLLADLLGLAPVHDGHIRIVKREPAAQIDECCGGCECTVLHQDRRQLELLV